MAAIFAFAAATPVLAESADDALAVQNLMSLRAVYAARGNDDAWIDLYSTRQPDVSFFIMGNTVRGLDNIKQMFRYGQPPRDPPGTSFVQHALLSPIIEVAADGKTAQGFWQSFGPFVSAGGNVPRGTLTWINYGVDFIKEDGAWKIWHIAVFGDFTIDMGETIAQKLNPAPRAEGPGGPGGPAARPQAPNPYPEWAPGRTPPTYPLPKPYSTFSETFSYGALP